MGFFVVKNMYLTAHSTHATVFFRENALLTFHEVLMSSDVVIAIFGSIVFALWAAHAWSKRCPSCNSIRFDVDDVMNNEDVVVHHCSRCGDFVGARRVSRK